VLTICRISPQKGLQYLVVASQKVLKKIPNVKFVLRAYASEMSYKQTLLNLIRECKMEDHFKIVEEFVPYEELPKYVAAFRYFCSALNIGRFSSSDP